MALETPGSQPKCYHHCYRQRRSKGNSYRGYSRFCSGIRLYRFGNRLGHRHGQGNDTGWGVYEESRKAGAIVATAHVHSYHRTFELSSTQNATVSNFNDNQANPINLIPDDIGTTGTDEGRNFVFVSGLGGRSIRNQVRCISGVGPGVSGDCQIWAAVYTGDQGANYGALFGEFNVNGDETLAHFYFKDIDNNIADDFWVRSGQVPPTPPGCR